MSIQTWYEQIEAAPDDWELRLQFADWLEENDEPVLAAGQRKQVTNRKRPAWWSDSHYHWGWVWWVAPIDKPSRVCFELSPHLWDRMAPTGGLRDKYFSSLERAEATLAEVLHQSQQETAVQHLD